MQTLFVGQTLIFISSTDSTNLYAVNLIRQNGALEGATIYTGFQTNGRGQMGTSWNSQEGLNVLASIILKPQFLPLKCSFYLSKIIALGLMETIAELVGTSEFIKIKWPNDILVHNKKIAGILIENIVSKNAIQYSVCGFGVNVNQIEFENNLKATSLKQILNKNLDVKQVLQLICQNIEKWYLTLKNNKLDLINSYYYKHLLGFKQPNMFGDLNQSQFTATIIGVTEDGQLILITEQNQQLHFDIKQIKQLY